MITLNGQISPNVNGCLNGSSLKFEGAFAIFAEALLANGYSPLPIVPGQKKPALRAWSDHCATPMTLKRLQACVSYWPQAGLGVALGYGGVIALDVDTERPDQLAEISEAVPPSPVAKAGAKGFTAFYRAPHGPSIAPRHFKAIADLLTTGTQTVLPPSRHPAGCAYRWLTTETLLTVPASELPEIPHDIVERLEAALSSWLPQRQFKAEAGHRTELPQGQDKRRLIAFAKAGLARKARDLAASPKGGRNNALFAFGAGLGRYVFHGLLSTDALETAAIAACGDNGLLREDGRLAVLATLHSGMARAKDDPLPVLKDRRASWAA